jgi:hypothetical protein
MGMAGLQAANNVASNDMVKFLLEFCFDPETPIKLESGITIPIKSLKIGDRLEAVNGVIPVVTSLFEFDGSNTPTVEVNGVRVSSKHYMRYDALRTMIEAGDHPDAKIVPSINRIICLNTSTHNLMINKIIEKGQLVLLIGTLIRQVNEFVITENKKNEVDELTETVCILYKKDLYSGDEDELIDGLTIPGLIQKIAKS